MIDADGKFYLGKIFDPEKDRSTEDLLLYDPEDLTTHGVVVGMTGSGKTGLAIGLLEEAAKKPKRILVRLLRDVPAIVGADMRPYGPFKREDVAVLPAENALALVGRGVAVEVKIDEDAEGD